MKTLNDFIFNKGPVFCGGGGDSGSSNSNDSGSSNSNKTTTTTTTAKKDETPTFNNLTEASKAGYHGKTVNIKGKGQQKVAFDDKTYDKKMAKASANAGTKSTTSASKPKTGTSKVDTSFADDILSGKTTNILPPKPQFDKIKISSSEQKKADKTMKTYGPKTAQVPISAGSSKTKTVDVGPKGQKVKLAPETVKKIEAVDTSKFTVSNDSMSTPYKGKGIMSKAQKSPGYLGVQGEPQNDYEVFLDRYNRQSIAAAADPYGQSTATGSKLTPQAEAMLQSAGLTGEEYIDKVMQLGKSLDDPRFGDGLIGDLIDSTMVGKGLDYLADMDKRRAYEQLTGQYDPTAMGKLAGYGSAEVVRVVPTFDANGNIVGSLEINADGEVISYTGEKGPDVRPADPTVVGWEDKVVGGDTGGLYNDNDNEPVAEAEEVVEVEPECPDGYVYDKDKKQCVIDPFQQPFPDAGTVVPTVTPQGLSPYTQVSPVQLGQLRPTVIGSVPQPMAAPVLPPVVAPVTQPGLAGLAQKSNV